MNILFSILIPAYKVKYLEEAIHSVLNQTYKDFELIIVNDASPENITDIVQKFNDSRIKYYINQKNCGAVNVVDNWNICLSYASGDYVICMGDDDCLLPNCLEDYYNIIHKYPNLGVYHGWTEIIDEHSNIIDLQTPRPEKECVYSLIWNRFKGRTQFIGDFLFNTKILKEVGGFYKLPLAWGSDDITAIIAASTKGIANTQSICFQYRINSRTISKTGNFPEKLEALRLGKEWIKIFINKKPDDKISQKYYHLLQTDINPYFNHRLFLTIKENIGFILSHPIKWIKIIRKENIPYKTRMKAYLFSINKLIQ